MNKSTRNALRNTVTHCRRLLEDSVAELLQGQFGIHPSGKIEEAGQLSHLSAEDQNYRAQILVHLHHIAAGISGTKNKDKIVNRKSQIVNPQAVAQLIREVAFTHLNRLAAYKMMERRGLIREAVSRGVKSQGFLFYLADHPDDEKLWSGGQQETAYRHFLTWLGSTLSAEIGVLFSPHDPANRLLPPQRVLDQVLELLNSPDLSDIWAEDETIGWVYQYFTPKELRDQARKESQAPRNSYELAFRNQFYTPRYVVQFLTDNTLGRIWYEMRRGETRLVEQCHYLVRRPNEVFLRAGDAKRGSEWAAKRGESANGESASSEIVNRKSEIVNPVYIPFRAKKDPRDLKILDPASGSGHFLLYCFDLLETIYEEAYTDPELGQALQADYPTLADLQQAAPGLILRHNLHGIDIDPRAVQIASLALWLRAQRSRGAEERRGKGESSRFTLHASRSSLSASRSPLAATRITKMNLVTAEPMPGEIELLEEFCAGLQPPVLGQLVKAVFHQMELAGEAGALLKIEEELQDAIDAAKKQWLAGPKPAQLALWPELAQPRVAQLSFDLSGVSGEQFWEQAEELVLAALREYAEQAANTSSPLMATEGRTEGGYLARRLFAEDTVRGFAFIDLCRQKFDVVLMNPPFGEPILESKAYLFSRYPESKYDVIAMFVERSLLFLGSNGMIGQLGNRTVFFGQMLEAWRKICFLELGTLDVFTDLGIGVLDEAMVEAVAYSLRIGNSDWPTLFFKSIEGEPVLSEQIRKYRKGIIVEDIYQSNVEAFLVIPSFPFSYWVPKSWQTAFSQFVPLSHYSVLVKQGMESSDNFRFVRLWWETPIDVSKWRPYSKGGRFGPHWRDIDVVVNWEDEGSEVKAFSASKYGTWTRQITNSQFYGRPGLAYPASRVEFSPRVLPAGNIVGCKGPIICYEEESISTESFLSLLAILSSSSFRALLNLTTASGDTMSKSYREQAVASIPVPNPEYINKDTIRLVQEIIDLIRAVESSQEVCHYFVVPHQKNVIEELVQKIRILRDELDIQVGKVYGFVGPKYLASESGFDDGVEHIESASKIDFQYILGCSFGRWDIRFGFDDTLIPKFPSPFAPLPICPPATLVGPDGMPATPGNIVSEEWLRARPNAISLPPPPPQPSPESGEGAWPTIPDEAYPLAVDWDGILVDDPDHPDDIVRRVRAVLELLLGSESVNLRMGAAANSEQVAGEQGGGGAEEQGGGGAGEQNYALRSTPHAIRSTPHVTPEAIEQEACDILGVKELRDYFRKPGKGGFWDDHVKRYSKSRRKAPIYWLLQSAKKNYALWLYYHRLDKDILYKALVNYVEPKIRLEEGRLEGIRGQLLLGRGAEEQGRIITHHVSRPGKSQKALERDLDQQESFVAELRDFRDKLRRAANLNLTPDLNDGVVLNIAPLWELSPWSEAKQYWEELLDGKYEWSSIGQQLRAKGLVKG